MIKQNFKLFFTNIWNSLYFILCFFLICIATWVSANLAFNGDFWEHSAAIKAFQDNIVTPPHPILNVDAAHHLFTPYHFVVAVFGNIFRLEAPIALSIFGPCNLFVFLYGIKAFVNRFSNFRNKGKVYFFVLVLTLFGWGGHVWFFSGFLSVRAFSFIAPYPSTLTFGLMLIGICHADKWLKNPNIFYLIYFGCSYIFIALTHQITFVMMSILALCLFFPHLLTNFRRIFPTVVIPILAICSMVFWPYYNVFELLLDNGEFQKSNNTMYDMPLLRIYPALLFLPTLIWIKRLDIHPALTYSLLLSTIFYTLGYFGLQPMMGRLISFIAFLGHFMTASSIAIMSQHIRDSTQKNVKYFLSLNLIGVFILTIIYLPMISINEKIRLNITFENGRLDYISAKSALSVIKQSDILLAPFGVGWELPSLAGKLVASKAGLAFVENHSAWQYEIKKICKTKISSIKLDEMVSRSNATKFLLPKNCPVKSDALNKFLGRNKLLISTPRYSVYSIK